MKVLFAGDTHGNLQHVVDTLIYAADREGCDRIFQLGDFGYWPRSVDGRWFLRELEKTLKAYGIVLYWLDGNHEDHTTLNAIQGRDKDPEGFWKISEHVRYSPRGHRWTWDGVRFLSLGGAYSIDRNYRVIGKSWFWEEMISPKDVEACGTDKVDFMLTHDVPAGIPMGTIMISQGRDFHTIPESYKNTMMVRQVVDAVNPELLFHGHYHYKYMKMLDNNNTNVVGLCCDGSGRESYVVVDLSAYGSDK